MGKIYPLISPEQRSWIAQQRVFFVATAPLSAAGHINCSPKGGDTFRVLGDGEVAYADLTGSGVETTAHLQENGRIVVLFCAFEGPPKIVRLHGAGEVVYPSDRRFGGLASHFPSVPGIRSVIRIEVSRVSDSCGFAVPFFDYVENRKALDSWAEKKGPEGLCAYRQEKNQFSIDGIPGYKEPDHS
jgi:hypothetical protein